MKVHKSEQLRDRMMVQWRDQRKVERKGTEMEKVKEKKREYQMEKKRDMSRDCHWVKEMAIRRDR